MPFPSLLRTENGLTTGIFVVKCTGRGLVLKRPGVLSKVQILTLVLGVGVFSLLPINGIIDFSSIAPEHLWGINGVCFSGANGPSSELQAWFLEKDLLVRRLKCTNRLKRRKRAEYGFGEQSFKHRAQ